MPRKTNSVIEQIDEPIIKVLTSQDIKENFIEADYFRIVKQCIFIVSNNYKQHESIWMRDESGEFHVVIKDRAYKTCSYLGSFEGAKFDVVLENKFFDKLKDFIKEASNEKSNSTSKFSIASNTSVCNLQEVSSSAK